MAAKGITEEDIRRKLKITGERLMRSGLSKADAGDLTRAAEDLELAVRYDKYNENARNLLGLVRFQTGELGEAMKQWGISLHLHPEHNRAADYMEAIAGEEHLLTDMSEAIALYNDALRLAGKNDLDFAAVKLKKAVRLSPRFVKAALLLSIIYIETEAYKAALGALDLVAQVDPLNPEAMRYRLHIARQQKHGAQDLTVDIQDLSRDLYVQQALPEPDMEEISSESVGQSIACSIRGFGVQLALLTAGLVLGIGLVGLLYVPGKVNAQKETVLEQQVQIAQLEEETARLSRQVEEAEEPLKKIGQGAEVTEVLRAEIRQLLETWGLELE